MLSACAQPVPTQIAFTPLVTIFPQATSLPATASATGTPTDQPTPQPTPTAHPLTTLAASLTTAQRLGQLMIVSIDGTTVTSETRTLLKDLHPGGIVLLEKNITTPKGTAAFINQLQSEARALNMPPLFIAIDQEGGQVTRLREASGFTEFPSPMAMAATPGGCATAGAAQLVLAREMHAIGINMNFAPLLDVNSNPANPVIGFRSFGSDPNRVTECAIAQIDALLAGHIIPVGKHFPGHGDTDLDSHVALPVINQSRARLEAVEFVPFRAAITHKLPALMSAHIVFPLLDDTPNLPATLSAKVIQGLLRGEMHFDGVLFSDALTMDALPLSGNPANIAAARALQAGVDVLLFGEGAATQRSAYTTTLAWLNDGRIPLARLDDALHRVLDLKTRYGVMTAQPSDMSVLAQTVGTPANRAVAQNTAGGSITVVRDTAHLLPLKPGNDLVLLENDYSRSSSAQIEISGTRMLVSLDPSPAEIARIVAATAGKRVIITTANIQRSPTRPRLVRALLAAKRQLVVIAVGTPYDVLYFPEVTTYIVVYGISPPTVRAISELLAGKLVPVGHLPVNF